MRMSLSFLRSAKQQILLQNKQTERDMVKFHAITIKGLCLLAFVLLSNGITAQTIGNNYPWKKVTSQYSSEPATPAKVQN